MASDSTAPMPTVVPPSRAEVRRSKRVPGWMSVAVVAAALAGGAWLLYWFVAGSAPRERTVTFSQVPPQARRGEGGGGPIANVFREMARTTSGVLIVRPGEWRVKSGDAVMSVAKEPKGGAFAYTFYYDRNDLVPPDQLALLVLRRDVVNDEDSARAMNLTPLQLDVFKKQQGETGMSLSPAERKRMADLWERYAIADAAGKPGAEKPLAAALDEIGKRNLEATKRRMSEHAKVVESTLTAEQLERLRERNRRIRRL